MLTRIGHVRISTATGLRRSFGVRSIRFADLNTPVSLHVRQFAKQAGRERARIFAAHASQSSTLGNRALETCKRILKWVARLAAISLLVAATLPSILSTGIGLQIGTNIASHFTEGDIEIEKADLGWLRPIHLSGVKYKLPSALGGDPIATAQTLSTKSRLWDVIVGRQYNVYGEKPWLDCSFSSSGQWKWTELSKYADGKQVARPKASLGSPELTQKPSLVKQTSEIAFSAEARLLTASVYFPNGIMKVPQEVKEVIGKDLHLLAIMGKSCLKNAAEDLDIDQNLDWAQVSSNSLSKEGLKGTKASNNGSPLQESSQENQKSLPEKAQKSSWLSWEALDPGIVSIQSENLKVSANGWRRRADGAYILKEPGRLEFQYTPALAQYVLGRLSPLLSGILAVDNGVVGVDVTPENLISPADNYHFRIEPLRIAIQKQGLLKSAIDFLNFKKGGLERNTLLQGVTSPIHVDVGDDGSVETQRLDLLVSTGGSSKGLHLCSWGSVKPTQDKLDINLGIPAGMLSYLGVKNVQKKDVLVVPVTGTFTRPSIDWKGAYKRISSFATSRQPSSITSAIFQGVVEDISKRLGSKDDQKEIKNVPDPVEVLPWELDKNILDDHVEPEE